MKRFRLVFWFALTAVLLSLPTGAGAVADVVSADPPNYKVLVLTEGAAGDVHAQYRAIQKAGKGIYLTEEVRDGMDSANKFNDKQLAKYRAVVFLNTNGDVLGDAEQTAFENYFKNGGSFVGIGTAVETESSWQFLTDILGARTATTLAAPAAIGATNIKVAGTGGITVGSTITVESESAAVSTVGTAGETGTGVTLTTPLTADHATGAKVGLQKPAVQSATVKVFDRVHDASKDLPQYWDAHRRTGTTSPTNVRGVSHVLAHGRRGSVRPAAAGPDARRHRRRHDGRRPPGLLVQGLPGRPLVLHRARQHRRRLRRRPDARTSRARSAGPPGQSDPVYSDCGATVLRNYQQTKISAPPNLQRADRLRPAPGRPDHPDRAHRHRAPAQPGDGHDARSSPTSPTRALPLTQRIYTNSEDGLYGPAVDNNFATNKWVYLFYSPQTVTDVKLSDGSIVTQTTPTDELAGHRGVEDRVGSVRRLLPALALQVRRGRRGDPRAWT